MYDDIRFFQTANHIVFRYYLATSVVKDVYYDRRSQAFIGEIIHKTPQSDQQVYRDDTFIKYHNLEPATV